MAQLDWVEPADDFVVVHSDGVTRQGHGGESEPKLVAQQGARQAAIHGLALSGLSKLAM